MRIVVDEMPERCWNCLFHQECPDTSFNNFMPYKCILLDMATGNEIPECCPLATIDEIMVKV